MSKNLWKNYSKARQKAIKWEVKWRNSTGMERQAAKLKFDKWNAKAERLFEDWQRN